MKSDWYILKDKHPVPVDMLQAAKWLSEINNKRIAFTEIRGIQISTVFLGLDHSFMSDIPVLFETMVFGGTLDNEGERYYTYQEAEEGHKRMCERVVENL